MRYMNHQDEDAIEEMLLERRERFADPAGESALWAAGERNPRNLPCPTCKAENRLTPRDRAAGYQCDRCADRAERGGDW